MVLAMPSSAGGAAAEGACMAGSRVPNMMGMGVVAPCPGGPAYMAGWPGGWLEPWAYGTC